MIPSIPDPSSSDSSDNLFTRAQAGDQDAWQELFRQCYHKVRRVVRYQIDGPLRRYVDSTDIASDVFGELAKKAKQFDFKSNEEVLRFLYHAAHQRIYDEVSRRNTGKRDMTRERPMPDGGEPWALSSREPTPSQIAVAKEEGERITEACGDEIGRLIVKRRKESYTNQEISEETGWSVRKVQRYLELLHTTSQN